MADALAKQEEIERNTKVVTWIPCTERMPKEFDMVLIYAPESGLSLHDIVDVDFWEKGRWHSYDGEATHWMPYPDPPKRRMGNETD